MKMSNVFLIMFAAIFAENFVFSKLFGVNPFLRGSDKPSGAIVTGLTITFAMTLSSAATYAVYYLFLAPLGLEYFKTVAFVAVIAAISMLVLLILSKFAPTVYSSLGTNKHLVTVNCAVLGAALINIQEQNSFWKSVQLGLFSGLGFAVAILVFAGIRAKMTFSDPPKAFKGFPILLIAAGLVAMAFSGLSGMRFS